MSRSPGLNAGVVGREDVKAEQRGNVKARKAERQGRGRQGGEEQTVKAGRSSVRVVLLLGQGFRHGLASDAMEVDGGGASALDSEVVTQSGLKCRRWRP